MTVIHSQATKQTVARFAHLPMPALIATANTLGLHMTEDTLRACAALYDELGRDPYVDELRLLDSLCLAYGRLSLKQAPLDSLQTEDARIVRTLKEILEHCPQQGGKTLPLTPERVLNLRVATPCTSPAVARKGAHPVLMADEDFATLGTRSLGANESICIEGTSFRLSLCHPEQRAWPTTPKRNDLITLLVTRPESDTQVYHRMQELLQQASSHVHAVFSVAKGELLPTLLERCDKGLRADVSLLNRELAHIGSSADEISGALVFSSVAAAKELRDRAQSSGLVCICFAQCRNDGLLSVAYRAETEYFLPLTLLHTLQQQLRLSVGIPKKESSATPLPCDCHSPDIQKDCASTVRQVLGKPVSLGEYKVIHTTLALSGELCPHHVELALMRAAQHLVAAGGDFATLQLGVGVCLNGQSTLAPLWSGILGTERMLRIWQMPALAPVIRRKPHPCFTCFPCRKRRISSIHGKCAICLP